MKRKILATMLCCSMILCVCGCGNTTDTEKETSSVVDNLAVDTEGQNVTSITGDISENEGKVLKTMTYYCDTPDDEECAQITYEFADSEIKIKTNELIIWLCDAYDEVFPYVFDKEVYQKLGIYLYSTDLGQVIRENGVYDNGKSAGEYECQYDEAGNLTKETHYDNGNFYCEYEYIYNEFGDLITLNIRRNNYEYEYEYENKYDNLGNLLNVSIYGDNQSEKPEIELKGSREYDETGNLLKAYDCFEDKDSREYEYDSSGKLLKIIYDNYDSGHEEYSYEFNSAGKLVKAISYDSYDNADYTVEYEYNNLGSLVAVKYYDFDGIEYAWINSEYDDSGKCLKLTYEEDFSPYGGNRLERCEYEFEYDDSGNIIKSTETYGKYEYTEAGNLRRNSDEIIKTYTFEYYE